MKSTLSTRIEIAIAAAVSVWLLVLSVQTFIAIHQFGDPDKQFFNRAMYVLAVDYFVLAVSVGIFPMRPKFSVALSFGCLFLATANMYIVSGRLDAVVGWFTLLPILGLVLLALKARQHEPVA